jgi:hypothetical protein
MLQGLQVLPTMMLENGAVIAVQSKQLLRGFCCSSTCLLHLLQLLDRDFPMFARLA